MTVGTDLEPAISIDYTSRLNKNINELQRLLGVTEMIPMSAGTNIKIYKMEQVNTPDQVGEGETIPLTEINRKLARTVDVYSKKPQLQERLNIEIADALMKYLNCKGCLVTIEAEHMCMNMRGVKKPGTSTMTSVARGAFEEDLDLKNEAYRLMGL